MISRVGVPQYEDAAVGFASLFGKNATLTGGPATVRATAGGKSPVGATDVTRKPQWVQQAKRAAGGGYRQVLWYKDGTDGWEAAGLPTEVLHPAPGGP